MGIDYYANIAVGFHFTLDELYTRFRLPEEDGDATCQLDGRQFEIWELPNELAVKAGCAYSMSAPNEGDIDPTVADGRASIAVFFEVDRKEDGQSVTECDIESRHYGYRFDAGGGISLSRLLQLQPYLDDLFLRLERLGLDMTGRVPGVHVVMGYG